MAHPTELNQRVNIQFQTFFDGWLTRQQNLTDKLFLAISPENTDCHNEQDQQILIDQVLSHYQQYFEEKSQASKEQVFLFFSPPWFNSFEKGFLWIGGFKPSLIFNILDNAIDDLTTEQKVEIERVKSEIKREERELGDTMASLQETVASPTLMSVMRHSGNLIDGEVSQINSAMDELQNGMIAALDSADALRGRTAMKVLEFLLPVQRIKLMAAIGQFQLRVRRWGQQSSNNTLDVYGPGPAH